MTGVLTLAFITTSLVGATHLILMKNHNSEMKFSEQCMVLVTTLLLIGYITMVNIGFILLIWLLLICICVFTLVYTD